MKTIQIKRFSDYVDFALYERTFDRIRTNLHTNTERLTFSTAGLKSVSHLLIKKLAEEYPKARFIS